MPCKKPGQDAKASIQAGSASIYVESDLLSINSAYLKSLTLCLHYSHIIWSVKTGCITNHIKYVSIR